MRKETNVNHSFKTEVEASTGFGQLRINSQPCANIFLDGADKGQTPLALDNVSAGEHEIRIVKEGFEEITRTVVVRPGKAETHSISLRRKNN